MPWEVRPKLFALLVAQGAVHLCAGVDPVQLPCSQRPQLDPYMVESSPFGWPLAPNDWSFRHAHCWAQDYLFCNGKRQSPIDIATVNSSNNNGSSTIASAAKYKAGATPQQVRVSKYMRTVMASGDFGTLELKHGDHTKEYEAIQVHITSESLHTIDGKSYDGEMMILHKPKDQPDMSRDGVIVSVLFQHSSSGDSSIFDTFGFKDDDVPMAFADSGWVSSAAINPNETNSALAGVSYRYEGSVPVPPCSESVTWFVLRQPLAVSPKQTKKVKDMLRMYTGGDWRKRPPVAHSGRTIAQNSLQATSAHFQLTCAAAAQAGNNLQSARCWENTVPKCGSSRSPVNIVSSAPVPTPGPSPTLAPAPAHASSTAVLFSNLARYKTQDQVTVVPGKYTLDVVPTNNGSFGHVLLHGRTYTAVKLSVRAIAAHTINGVRHHGEIVIEHVLYGDRFTGPNYHPEPHRVMVSVPITLGSESPLLRHLGLGYSASKQAIHDLHPYPSIGKVDLMGGLEESFSHDWVWYNGSLLYPDCTESVKWMVFTTPISANLYQLNYLDLPVSGVDSVREVRELPQSASWVNQLPEFAVDANPVCPPGAPWGYEDVRCWGTKYPTCHHGQAQSPINIPSAGVQDVGKDNFLRNCYWKPVSALRIANTGHNLQVTNEQLGYISQINREGFVDYYQIVQFHIHMPSEHLIDGKEFPAELHIVHKKQKSVTHLLGDELLVTAIMFEFGQMENPLLKQLFLPQSPPADGAYSTAKRPIDLMRAFGPTLDGGFFRYNGSLTTPPCSETVKWFVFETPQQMSMAQWGAFKSLYPTPANNRPVQPLNHRPVYKNSFEDGDLAAYTFFLSRNQGRNRRLPTAGWILFPIVGAALLATVVMCATFVRGGLILKRHRNDMQGAEMIGKGYYRPM